MLLLTSDKHMSMCNWKSKATCSLYTITHGLKSRYR